MGAKGIATLAFGSTPASTATVDVTGQTGLTTAAYAAGTQAGEAFFTGRSSTDFTADQYEEAAALCHLVCSCPADGTLRITAHTLAMLGTGDLTVNWVWD